MIRSIAFRLPAMQVRCGLCGTVAHELRVQSAAGRAEAVVDCSCTIPEFEILYSDGSETAATVPLRPSRTK